MQHISARTASCLKTSTF
ncbi:hypothetical protein KUF71_023591 [Frankliniella fusca]|uniref:Uncharacterized protein n=1 Tax=Frankliniella fusca TaxID=407009 RepID=A0AAE1LC40_9NEOP|nr:hypothetical protein KUF71_023591 [Frankliniella fusca]